MRKPHDTASPYIQKAYLDYRKSQTFSAKAESAWWRVQHFLFSPKPRAGKKGYYAHSSQPRCNWPFAIWARELNRKMPSWY